MEINNYEEITGVTTTADVVEGRFGVLTSHSQSYDFGSKTDLPAFKVPDTAEEANNARQLIAFAVDARPYPAFLPVPSYSFALRQGFGSATNAPFTATVYLSNPANQEGRTIPSGTMALAFGKGTYTLESGCFVDSAGIKVPGALVQVANTAEDGASAGLLKVLTTYGTRKVGTVRQYNSTTGRLTVDID